MKTVTEFASYTLNQAIKNKTALAAEGKSPEEIQTSIAETFKLEGDKLKHFINAIEVATLHSDNLKRVLVVSLAEGESAPAKATKVEESYYVPEALVQSVIASAQKSDGGRGGKGGRGGGRGEKKSSSPWGMSPEEKAAKNKGAANKAAKPS